MAKSKAKAPAPKIIPPVLRKAPEPVVPRVTTAPVQQPDVYSPNLALTLPTIAPVVTPAVALRGGVAPSGAGYSMTQPGVTSPIVTRALPPDERPTVSSPFPVTLPVAGAGFWGSLNSPGAQQLRLWQNQLFAQQEHRGGFAPSGAGYSMTGNPNQALRDFLMGEHRVPVQQPDRYSPNLALTLPRATPWYEMPKPEDKPVLTGYDGGGGGGGWSGEGGGGGGGTSRGGGYGSGLIIWRIRY